MMIPEAQIKQRIQSWMVAVSLLLLVGKFAAYFLTDSVGILTDAMESIVNVVAGAISLLALYLAAKPKDAGHPFGHGKMELISASAEGLMICGAGALIIWEGVARLFDPVMPGRLDVGIMIVAAAGLVNYLAGWYSIRMGRQYNSVALVASGRHLQSDTYSSIGLVVGLVLLYVTKVSWIDAALALIFGGIILWTGISILRQTISTLTDKADPEALKGALDAIEVNRQSDWVDVHNLKIIKYGSFYYIDCDLTLPWYYNIAQGHDACNGLKCVLETYFQQHALVSIHSDPCRELHCSHCQVEECGYRKEPFMAPLVLTLDELTMNDEMRRAAGEEGL